MFHIKLLWFNWRDIKNPEAGGAEVFTHEVCKRLIKMGYQITLFTSEFDSCKKEEEIDGVSIVRRGSRYGVYRECKKYYMDNRDKFDLIVDEINTRPFLAPRFANGTPVIGLIHQLAREFWFHETSFPINVMGYLFMEKMWLSNYRDVPMVTVSESTKEDLERMGMNDIHIIPEGQDVHPLDAPVEKEKNPTLIFVGRFKRAKKPQDAIRAFLVVKKELPESQLWMVGDGYMMDELKRMVDGNDDGVSYQERENGKGNEHVDVIDAYRGNGSAADDECITFFGRVPDEVKHELMARAHVLLVPGVREGWGLVVTEANAMGTPAVAYDVPGLRDSVVNKVTGVLVAPNDHVAMALAALDLLRNEEKRNLYSKNAIRWAKKFSWDRTAWEFSQVIDHYTHSPEKRAKKTAKHAVEA